MASELPGHQSLLVSMRPSLYPPAPPESRAELWPRRRYEWLGGGGPWVSVFAELPRRPGQGCTDWVGAGAAPRSAPMPSTTGKGSQIWKPYIHTQYVCVFSERQQHSHVREERRYRTAEWLVLLALTQQCPESSSFIPSPKPSPLPSLSFSSQGDFLSLPLGSDPGG